jgi:hypothetical protein
VTMGNAAGLKRIWDDEEVQAESSDRLRGGAVGILRVERKAEAFVTKSKS